jgi:hypothetical protein
MSKGQQIKKEAADAVNKLEIAKKVFYNVPEITSIQIENYDVVIWVNSRYFYNEIKDAVLKYGFKIQCGRKMRMS